MTNFLLGALVGFWVSGLLAIPILLAYELAWNREEEK